MSCMSFQNRNIKNVPLQEEEKSASNSKITDHFKLSCKLCFLPPGGIRELQTAPFMRLSCEELTVVHRFSQAGGFWGWNENILSLCEDVLTRHLWLKMQSLLWNHHPHHVFRSSAAAFGFPDQRPAPDLNISQIKYITTEILDRCYLRWRWLQHWRSQNCIWTNQQTSGTDETRLELSGLNVQNQSLYVSMSGSIYDHRNTRSEQES